MPLAFHVFNLLEQQLEAVDLAADLRPDIARELAAIAGSQLIQALATRAAIFRLDSPADREARHEPDENRVPPVERRD